MGYGLWYRKCHTLFSLIKLRADDTRLLLNNLVPFIQFRGVVRMLPVIPGIRLPWLFPNLLCTDTENYVNNTPSEQSFKRWQPKVKQSNHQIIIHLGTWPSWDDAWQQWIIFVIMWSPCPTSVLYVYPIHSYNIYQHSLVFIELFSPGGK